MKAGLEVDVHTDITRVHLGHSYTRARHVTNALPVMVNLVSTTVISAVFDMVVPPTTGPPSGACKSVILMVACTEINFTTMMLECQDKYGDPNGLTCESVECSGDPKDFTQVNFEENLAEDEEMGSQQDEIDALRESLISGGWDTASYTGEVIDGPCIEFGPESFVIFIEARENVLVGDVPTITIVMETHSAVCIDQ